MSACDRGMRRSAPRGALTVAFDSCARSIPLPAQCTRRPLAFAYDTTEWSLISSSLRLSLVGITVSSLRIP
jgi:hypothetical protein